MMNIPTPGDLQLPEHLGVEYVSGPLQQVKVLLWQVFPLCAVALHQHENAGVNRTQGCEYVAQVAREGTLRVADAAEATELYR